MVVRYLKLVAGSCLAAGAFVVLASALVPIGYAILSWPFFMKPASGGGPTETGWTWVFAVAALAGVSAAIGFYVGGLMRLGPWEAVFTAFTCGLALTAAWFAWQASQGALPENFELARLLVGSCLAQLNVGPFFVVGARAGARSRANSH